MRRACLYLGLPRSPYPYAPTPLTDRKEQHYQRIITLSWDHPRYGSRLFQLHCFRWRVQMIIAIPFLHGCSAPSGPDDSGDGDNEMRAVSINRHAEFAAPGSTSPLSDSENQCGWVFRNDLSEEFDGSPLDTRRGYVAGAPYVYNELPPGLTEDSDGSSVDWLGHPPSVFGMWNYFRADGKLHLLVEWEPDAEFFPVLDQEAEEIIDDVCKCPL